MSTLKLAWRYIQFHKLKSLILVACIFLASFLPIAVHILLSQFDQEIVARAESTPTVIGAKGSRLELALDALYFHRRSDSATSRKSETIPYSLVSEITEKGWGQSIPLYTRYTAKGKPKRGETRIGDAIANPIVGTTLDYFEFRGLEMADGQMLSMLGDCVLGADVARRLGLSPGDRIASDAVNILDISGAYPLNMLVRGVLLPTATPDDQAIFVDIKTVWIIDDLGHGHQEATSLKEGSRLATEGNKITTNAAVSTYTEINESNIASFHFHGDTADFPITSIIAIANSVKSETLMLAYFETDVENAQIVLPIDEVRELMSMVFQVEQFFWLGAILIATSTLLLLVLVVFLSLRLRKREMQTMFKLGCSRSTIAALQFWELLFVFAMASLLVAIAVWAITAHAGELVQGLLLAKQ